MASTTSVSAVQPAGAIGPFEWGPQGNSAAGARRSAGQRSNELSNTDKQVATHVARVDREVRAHERIEVVLAGDLARGGATYTYRRGPDGQLYAVGGEVPNDIPPGRTPPQHLRQAQTATWAPAASSAQDRAEVAAAAQTALEAQIELAQQYGDRGPTPAGTIHATHVSPGTALAFYRASESENLAAPRRLIDVFV